MGIFSFFKRKENAQDKGWRTGGMEDFMTLIRVYYQAALAAKLHISNLALLPDLRIFKQTLKVPTQGNRLGLSEKNRCRAMLMDIYQMPEPFFKECDTSIDKHCRNMQQMQQYMFSFQAFTQELMIVVGSLMKWKFRVPGFMKKALYAMTEKTIQDICTKDVWKDASVQRGVMNVRRYSQQLGYSQQWMTDFVYHVIILAKKEPKPQDAEEKK